MTALITAQERAQLLQGTGTVNSYGINNQEVIDILNNLSFGFSGSY